MPPGFSVKRANLTNAKRIPGVHVRSVRTTYQNDLPAAFLSGLRASDTVQETRDHVQDPRRCMYVLLHNQRVIGYVEAGILAVHGEALLINEYILDAYRDLGLGACLLLRAVECLLNKNVIVMAGQVAATNARMQHVCSSKWHGVANGPVQMQMGPYVIPGVEYIWQLQVLHARLRQLCP